MNLPKLSKPVLRTGFVVDATQKIQPSSACSLCHQACSHLPGFLQGYCNRFCNSAICAA